MKILITGVQNVVKDSAVKLALERIEGKAKLKIFSFSDFALDEEPGVDELQLLRNTQQKLAENIQLCMLKASVDQHIIINGYCTVKTRLGFFPIITRGVIDVMQPDIIVHIDVAAPVSAYGKKRLEFEEHQLVEKLCAMSFGAFTGSVIKIVKCGKEGPRPGADELFKLLKDVLVVK